MKQTKTIPFNWELYNNNRDKYKIVTRNGDEVTQLTKFEGITSFVFIGCHVPNGIHVLRGWQIDGKFYKGTEYRHDLQLQYEEEVKESWVNLYREHNNQIITSRPFFTKYQAESYGKQHSDYIKTINLNDLV